MICDRNMSEKSKGIKIEIRTELEVIKDVILETTRSMGALQKGIILKTRIDSLIFHINELGTNQEISTQEIAEFVEEMIEEIAQILNVPWPENKKILESYYNLSMLRTNFICNLMDSWGEDGKLRLKGTANVLADLVTGVTLPNLEELLPRTIEHHDFFAKYNLASNYINMYTMMHYIAACQMYTIDYGFLW